MQRVVVIGSGAAALAVLDALAGRAGFRVTLIRPNREFGFAAAAASDRPTPQSVEATIAALRADLGIKFPPPKSHFGTMPETIHVQGWSKIWRSNLHGGLTQFWGGSMVPFTDRELSRWPIGRGNLDVDYRAIAERVGITGADDALRGYLRDDFAEMPPVEPIPAIETLVERLRSVEGSAFDIVGGAARVAVETRSGYTNACTYSGECMTGCRQGAVFSAREAIDLHSAQGTVTEQCRGLAERVDFDRKTVEVRLEDGSVVCIDYDLAFVCAGCVHSTELLIDSLETEPEASISDNMILSFPVFYGGGLPAETKADRYFALTNGMLALVPHDIECPTMFIQLYPSPDYFWQYNLPRWVWPVLSGLARMGRNRLFWARTYVSSEQSQAYRMMRTADGTALTLARQPDLAKFTEEVWPQLRQCFAEAGFWVPPVGPVRAKTSSHYAGGFPMGGKFVGQDGALGNGVYLCDSANFPDCPALSPTFTVMANARRIARDALRD